MQSQQQEKTVTQALLGTAIALLAGFLGLAFAILRKQRKSTCRVGCPCGKK
jgi:hypothetical protein